MSPSQAPEVQEREVDGRPLASFTTQDLLKGLVFGDGPVAEKLPTIRAQYHLSSAVRDTQALQTMRGFIEQTVSTIMAERSEFATRFRSDILSNDHLRIRHAMEEGAVVATNVMVEDRDFQAAVNSGFAADNSRGLCIVFVVGFVAVAYAVVFNAAAAVLNVGLVVNLAVLIAVQAWVEVGNPWFGVGVPADVTCPEGSGSCPVDRATSALMADQLIGEIAEQGVEVWAYEGERLEYRTRQVYTDGRASWLLGHGDFDGDGRQDRLYWPEKGTAYRITTAKGVHIEDTLPAGPNRIYVGDFDGNGRDDVMAYAEQTGSATLHYFQPDLSHTKETHQLLQNVNASDYFPIVGKFVPPDRADDILMWGFGAAREVLFSGQTRGLIGVVAPILNEDATATPVVGAFYGRKDTDNLLMYTAGQTTHKFYSFENIEDPGTTRPGDPTVNVVFQDFITSDHPLRPVVADFDGNGWDDIYWYSNSDGGRLGDGIYVSDGSAFKKYPDLRPDETPPDPAWGQPEDSLFPVAFDADGNSRPDLFWWRVGYVRP